MLARVGDSKLELIDLPRSKSCILDGLRHACMLIKFRLVSHEKQGKTGLGQKKDIDEACDEL